MFGTLTTEEARRRAAAELELRARAQRRELGPRYDWFALGCPCGKPLGQCRDHPRARPSQRPPGSPGASDPRSDWRIWLIDAGRGFGKSRCACQFLLSEIAKGKVNWAALVNETVKDVRDSMIEHPESGILALSPPWFMPVYEPSKARVTWPNGAFATIYSAENPEALRGPAFGLAWVDELAKWKFRQQEVWDNLEFCLRAITEPRPRVVVSTTPRPTPTFKALLDDPRAAITGGPMRENSANLDPDWLARMEQKYQGTRLGRQELEAVLHDDIPGALWQWDWIDGNRVLAVPGLVGLSRVVTAVDPNAGAQDPESKAETGIITAGLGTDRHGYILADDTTKGSPSDWATAALRAYAREQADLIVAEKNNGGDMVEHTIRSIPSGPGHPDGRDVPIKLVWASRGKETRAQPIAALYEQGRVHHVGEFRELETQMTQFDPSSAESRTMLKDRMDAAVWSLSELLLGPAPNGMIVTGGNRPALNSPGAR